MFHLTILVPRSLYSFASIEFILLKYGFIYLCLKYSISIRIDCPIGYNVSRLFDRLYCNWILQIGYLIWTIRYTVCLIKHGMSNNTIRYTKQNDNPIGPTKYQLFGTWFEIFSFPKCIQSGKYRIKFIGSKSISNSRLYLET